MSFLVKNLNNPYMSSTKFSKSCFFLLSATYMFTIL